MDNDAQALLLACRLIGAADNGHDDVVQLLLRSGVPPDASDLNRWTALMCAARSGHTKVANVLLEAGANCDATNIDGSTALMYAVEAGHRDVVTLLLKRRPNIEIKNRLGFNAVTIAEENNRREIRDILLTHMDPLTRKVYELGKHEKPPRSLRDLNRCPKCGHGFALEGRPWSGTVHVCQNCGHLILLSDPSSFRYALDRVSSDSRDPADPETHGPAEESLERATRQGPPPSTAVSTSDESLRAQHHEAVRHSPRKVEIDQSSGQSLPPAAIVVFGLLFAGAIYTSQSNFAGEHSWFRWISYVVSVFFGFALVVAVVEVAKGWLTRR